MAGTNRSGERGEEPVVIIRMSPRIWVTTIYTGEWEKRSAKMVNGMKTHTHIIVVWLLTATACMGQCLRFVLLIVYRYVPPGICRCPHLRKTLFFRWTVSCIERTKIPIHSAWVSNDALSKNEDSRSRRFFFFRVTSSRSLFRQGF